MLRNADLILLAAALVVFLVAGFPMLGYAVAAAAWLAQRAIQLAAERYAARALAEAERRSAMGALAAATLARVWLVAMAILLVGLAERKAGLAAAVLSAALVTAYFLSMICSRLFASGERQL